MCRKLLQLAFSLQTNVDLCFIFEIYVFCMLLWWTQAPAKRIPLIFVCSLMVTKSIYPNLSTFEVMFITTAVFRYTIRDSSLAHIMVWYYTFMV